MNDQLDPAARRAPSTDSAEDSLSLGVFSTAEDSSALEIFSSLEAPSAPEAPSALQIASHPAEHPSFDQFVATIAALRAPDGCPWDKEQTHGSIAHNMIEEAYEAVDAIEAGNVAHLREELGDVLLQVVLQSQIAQDAGEFTIDDVCADVNAKIVRRHPHVFGDASAASAGDVLNLWDQVKLAERRAAAGGAAAEDGSDRPSGIGVAGESIPTGEGGAGVAEAPEAPSGLLDSVPRSFPALMQAQKISRKAAAAGFEWDALDDVWAKVHEEVGELREAYAAAPKTPDGKLDAAATAVAAAADAAAVEMELGDVLFALVNVARHMGVDSETALRVSCGKFRARWSFMEKAACEKGVAVEDLTSEEQESLWNEAKGQE